MSELISQALDLVLYGMGSVFVFLTVLVGMTMLMSYLVGTEVVTEELASTKSTDNALIAAISAAVKRYRADREK